MHKFILIFCLWAQGFALQAEDIWPREVNEGELEFLTSPVDAKVLHSDNQFIISADSLKTGWIKMYQCYRNIDPVAKVEVVYQYREMKNLALVSTSGIAKAEVFNNSVQLEDVSHGATLCVKASVRNFYQEDNLSYTLKNGPFMRKFLDGYYPFLLSIEVVYPDNLLTLEATEPEAQAGFNVNRLPGKVTLKAWFAGRLNTKLRFTAAELI